MIAISYHNSYRLSLPADHRFPMLKYELLMEQLLHRGLITASQILSPQICPQEVLALTHSSSYLDKLNQLQLSAKEQRAIGFPQTAEMIEREYRIMQGTIDCALYAWQHKSCALNIAGGTHHAFADRGEGFCICNDMAVAANYLLQQGIVQRILIIDLDVHQGNGTASIFSNSKNVFTMSMHGAHNYPFHKEISHLDIPLQDGTTTTQYLELLASHLPAVLDTFQPQFAFYLCGVDILNTDKFGKLAVTPQGCAQRDAFVFQQLKQRNIPVACAMGGGYSADIKIIVDAHYATFEQAEETFS
jgi:acetoin utilization deacetylase AcuC-like enzyme